MDAEFGTHFAFTTGGFSDFVIYFLDESEDFFLIGDTFFKPVKSELKKVILQRVNDQF